MRKLLLTTLVTLALLALAGTALAGGRPFTTTLTGAAELPNPGDPDGSGTATVTLNPGQEEACWEITVSDITLPGTAAHIHIGAVDTSGPPVVDLTAPDESGTSSGCTSASRELLLEIIQNPSNYYVNVHNADFPPGAVRGQLSRAP